MDPDWPRNPPNTIICVLCRSSINYANRNPDVFFRHLMADHQTYHNFNILLEVSLVQPGFDYGQHASHQNNHNRAGGTQNQQIRGGKKCPERSDPRPQQEHYPTFSNSPAPATTEENQSSILPDNSTLNDLGEFDLSFLSEVTHYNPEVKPTRLKAPLEEVASAESSPQASKEQGGVQSEARIKNLSEECKQKNSTGDSSLGNGNRHLVPDDLKSLIIGENPERNIKFTLSQRLNTQMVVDDFVLKKKKGPFLSRGGRVINWKCVNDSCTYTCVSYEGQLQDHCKVRIISISIT